MKIYNNKINLLFTCILVCVVISCDNNDEGIENTSIDYTILNSREANTSVENVDPFTICGDCLTEVYPNQVNQPNAFLDDNGFWHIEWYGATYSNWDVEYSGINDSFKVNGIPLIKSSFVTDFWYTLNSVGLMTSYYSLWGDFSQGFQNAIATAHREIVITLNTDEIFNSSGAFTRDGELQGGPVSYSREDYTTQVVLQHFEEMNNDTITLIYQTEFAYDDENYRQVKTDSIKYIVNVIE